MDVVLKVKPEELKAKADEIRNQISKIERSWEKISTLVKASKSYWEGDASQAHQKHYKTIDPEIKQLLKRLREHPRDLLEMAGIYSKAESKIQALSGKLPEDLII